MTNKTLVKNHLYNLLTVNIAPPPLKTVIFEALKKTFKETIGKEPKF